MNDTAQNVLASLVVYAIAGFVLMFTWNSIAASMFSAPETSFLPCFALITLISMIRNLLVSRK